MALSNLQLRLISAAVLIPVVFAALYFGGWFFSALVGLIAIGCISEWFGIVTKLNLTSGSRMIYLVCGILYFIVSCALFGLLRTGHDEGLVMAIALLLCVWGSDTGGYILGRTIGGPKLAPAISPNKTWAGLVGAMLGAALGLALMLGLNGDYNLVLLIVFGCILGVVGQAGDLLESFFKRRAGLKDSGKVIPGHGGVLDRVDALLMMVPVFYLMITFGL